METNGDLGRRMMIRGTRMIKLKEEVHWRIFVVEGKLVLEPGWTKC